LAHILISAMSKLNADMLSKTIKEMLTNSTGEKKRKFIESVELQVGLKNIDVAREKKFNGAVVLPSRVKSKMSFVVIGDQKHCDEAQEKGIAFIDSAGLTKFKKDKKKIKKWAKTYDCLLASDSLVRQIPRIAGPQLSKMGKFPSPASHDTPLLEKCDELHRTVRFQMKKVLCLGVPVGTVNLSEEEIVTNITLAVNTLIGLLKKGWQNVKSLHIKTSMGPSTRVY